MDNEVFDIEELLKTHLSDGQQRSKEDLFPKIEEKLLKRKRKRRFLWIFFWVGLGAGLLTAGTFFYKSEEACECEERSKGKMEKSEWGSENRNDSKIHGQRKQEEHGKDVDSQVKTISEKKSIENQEELEPETIGNVRMNQGRGGIRSNESGGLDVVAQSFMDKQSNMLALAEMPNEKLKSRGDDSLSSDLVGTIEGNDARSKDSIMKSTEELNDSTTVDLPALAIEKQDSLILVDTINPEKNKPRFAFFVHGGATMYDMAVFKPYFTSGVLSNRSFKSIGWEITVGGAKRLGDHFDLQFSLNYNQKNTQFSYDLLVGEEEYMNLQIENQPIALEQLDQENSCNCFLAKGASLEYGVSTVSLMTGIDYRPFLWEKIRLSTSLHFGTNALTSFKNMKQQVVEFPSQKREFFSTFSMRLGCTVGYSIRENLSINLYPGYTISLAGRSDLYARNIRELALPIGVRVEF